LTDLSLIAIVDDDDAVRGSTETLLRSLGFATRTFASAESFLQSSLLSETICLILDVQMPNMSGVELQARLSELGVDIPIIFITAYPNKNDETRALNAGATGFLRKPVNEQRLVECLGEAVSRRRGPASAV
jgi:FixJ family two-component response regulator